MEKDTERMTHGALFAHPQLAVAMAVAGLIFGLFYFALLHCSVILFAAGHGWIRPIGLTIIRIGGAVAFLFGAAKLGAAPLLAAFIGFLIARVLALRVGRTAR
jgi:hypothetical protein